MISVIIPAYNIETYLPRCLESILTQTYRDLEIVLVDDGSTDLTGAICDEYARRDSRIVVIHKENGGVSSARNLGLDRATGEYIAFVDGDDILHRDYFLVLLENAVKHNSDISVCRLEMISTDGERRVNCSLETGKIEKVKILEGFFFDENIKEIMYGPYNKLFRTDVVGTTRFKNYRLGEDLLFVFMILDRCTRIYFDEYVGYSYIRREGSATKSDFSKARLDYIYAASEIEELCRLKYPYAYQASLRWLYIHKLVALRNLNKYIGLKKECLDFHDECMKFIKMHKKAVWDMLPIKRRVDYYLLNMIPWIYRAIL